MTPQELINKFPPVKTVFKSEQSFVDISLGAGKSRVPTSTKFTAELSFKTSNRHELFEIYNGFEKDAFNKFKIEPLLIKDIATRENFNLIRARLLTGDIKGDILTLSFVCDYFVMVYSTNQNFEDYYNEQGYQ